MLRRVTDVADPRLPREVPLRALLDAKPLTGAGLPALSVGRNQCDVELGCGGFPVVVSRRHAAVVFDGEAFTLVDHDARNGTFVRRPHCQGPFRVRASSEFYRATDQRRASPALRTAHAARRRRHQLRRRKHGARAWRFPPPRAPFLCSLGASLTQRPWLQFTTEGVVRHNPYRFLFEAEAEAQQPAQATQTLALAAAAPGSATAAPQPTAGRRRAREEQEQEDTQRPATRRRTRAEVEARPRHRALDVDAAALAPPAQEAAAAVAEVTAADAAAAAAATRQHSAAVAAVAAAARERAQAAAAAKAKAAQPLPTFEPLSVEPLKGDTVGELVAGMAAESACSICFDTLVAPHVTLCSHVFCGECLSRALKVKPQSCPECRARPGKPLYVRKLDALLCAVVEPRLSAAEAEERQRRKRSWQAMQLAAARSEHSDVEAAAARWLRTAMGEHPVDGGQQLILIRTDDDDDGGGDGTWSVDYARAAGRLVCHACFLAVAPGSVRVVRERGAGPPQRRRAFFHLACCPSACPGPHALQGLDTMPPADREAIGAALQPAPGLVQG